MHSKPRIQRKLAIDLPASSFLLLLSLIFTSLLISVVHCQSRHLPQHTESLHAQRRAGGVGIPNRSGSSERRLLELLSRQSPNQELAQGVQKISIGAILPKTALKTVIRAYQKRLQDAVESLTSTRGGGGFFNFTAHFQIAHAQMILLSVNPSPTEILSVLCDQLLPQGISAILYMSNTDVVGNNAASAQHLMQLTGYFGIPVIAWNPDNIGLEQVSFFGNGVKLIVFQSIDLLPRIPCRHFN